MAPEYRKFSVDPQITSFEVLQSLLARAFDIKGEFTISYLARDDEGQETYLSLLSDWDLDAAFLSSSDPCLQLKVDLKPFEEGLDDWDIITPVDLTRTRQPGVPLDKQSFTGTLLNHMERTFNLVQRALNIGDNENNAENSKPTKPPMTDSEFHNYLDCEGRLVKPKELRLSVYHGGLEPSLRKVVWKHILNVYPEGLSGKERMAYMKRKSAEYEKLCKTWKSMLDTRSMSEEMQFVTNMVRKDVLRTDRTHKFYAGADDNKNVASLFNILTTYALNHPSVSYCQGMSDLASPILVTMKDEAQAYVCFCALMQRLKPNFQLDGIAMTTKFQHLSELLQYYDPQFFDYLKMQAADDLLFCYRWLLLELKREFAFEDALLMLEVLWSSLPPTPPAQDLKLFEVEFAGERVTNGPQSPMIHSRENPYTKVRAIRKQNSTSSIKALVKVAAEGDFSSMRSRQSSFGHDHHEECHCCLEEESGSSESGTHTLKDHDSLPDNHRVLPAYDRRCSVNDGESSADDSQEYPPMTTSITRELRIDLENLNRHIPGSRHYYYAHPLKASSPSATHDSDPDSPQSKGTNSVSESLRSAVTASSAPPPTQLPRKRASVDPGGTEEEAPDTRSWTSDDQSESENIHRIGSLGRRRKCLDFLRVNGLALNSGSAAASANAPETQTAQFCTTPDEQCELDFDDQNKSSSLCTTTTTNTADSICNGEIFENELSPDDEANESNRACHLKSVIPIHLIRSSSGGHEEARTRHVSSDSDTSATSSSTSSASSDAYPPGEGCGSAEYVNPAALSNNHSEGYVSDANLSSKEASVQLERSFGPNVSKFQDSGLADSVTAFGTPTTLCEEALEYSCKSGRRLQVPPPNELGGGNPFMLFICLTLLVQHRDLILRSRMDYNELAMHFDKMVRKHHVQRVLNQAREMFAEYLRLGWQEDSWESTDNNLPV